MHIAGWQKVSLVDYPGKVACTLFTGGCNLRCPYCHNSELLEGEMPSQDMEEVMAYLDVRKGILDGVVISGGEPCLQSDLVPFLARLKEKGLLVKLDTNGCFPDRLEEILDAHLVDYVAMDWKTIRTTMLLPQGWGNPPCPPLPGAWKRSFQGQFPLSFVQPLWNSSTANSRSKKSGIICCRSLGKTGKRSRPFISRLSKTGIPFPLPGSRLRIKKPWSSMEPCWSP